MKIKAQSGFTLVEVLVVLIIVGFASVLLTQGLGQIFTARARLGPFIDQSEDASRIGIWFRQVAGGVMPDTLGGANVFTGTDSIVQGLTVMPMGAVSGAPTPFRMELATASPGSSALRISSYGGPTIDLFTWRDDEPGANSVRFSYFDGTQWVDHWPLADSEQRFKQPLGSIVNIQPPQLPKLIRLDAILGGRPWVLVAAPHGPDRPLPKLSDLFGSQQ